MFNKVGGFRSFQDEQRWIPLSLFPQSQMRAHYAANETLCAKPQVETYLLAEILHEFSCSFENR